GPLSYPERQSQHLERFFKGKIGKQRASWLAPRSHVGTFVPIKGQSPSTRHIHSTISQFESRRGDTSYPSPVISRNNCRHSSKIYVLKSLQSAFLISLRRLQKAKRENLSEAGSIPPRFTVALRHVEFRYIIYLVFTVEQPHIFSYKPD
ncbi:hypothetical protein K0M31_019552, partial [Melipona bicolor]